MALSTYQEASMSFVQRISSLSLFAFIFLLGSSVATAGWKPGSESPEAQGKADADIAQTIATFKTKDPGLKRFFNEAAGYAVFPTVGKGGIGIGGAYGEGKVYRSARYMETPWIQSADIVVDETVVGSVSVSYTREMPTADHGPFLKEETKLIHTIRGVGYMIAK